MLLSYLIHHFRKIMECGNDFFITFAKSKILRPKNKSKVLTECLRIQSCSISPQYTPSASRAPSFSQGHRGSEHLRAGN